MSKKLHATKVALDNIFIEILLYENRAKFNYDTFKVFDYEFTVNKHVSNFMGNGNTAANVANGFFIVVKDETVVNEIYQLQKEAYGDYSSNLYNYYGFDNYKMKDIQFLINIQYCQLQYLFTGCSANKCNDIFRCPF